MPAPLRILFLAAEAAPFAKTGGLADVVGSLPQALAALGHDVRVVIPAYGFIEDAARHGPEIATSSIRLNVPIDGRTLPAGVFESRLNGSRVPIYFIAERNLFARSDLYGYWDDPYRFAFFSRAALDLLVAALGWRPDIVHAHDWHAAPAVLWLATEAGWDERYRGIPSVITIHNLLHQGRAPGDILRYLGIRAVSPLLEEGPGEINLLGQAIFRATMVSTVSPTYSREILTPRGGAALDALLRYRHFDVHGILNGIDDAVWNPATDAALAARFDAGSVNRRVENKRALQARLGLPQRADIPMIGMVSRLDAQKGFDIVGHALHLLLNGHAGEVQVAVLGAGASQYEDMLRHLAGYHRDKMTAVLGYDAGLAPLIYGGSDIFLMPSLFEPCGLGQMIAMRYGSVPVARATGGLADTVFDGVTGFTFTDYRADDLWDALRRALFIYWNDRESWRAVQRAGMARDSSWSTSARGYQQLYEWAMARQRGW